MPPQAISSPVSSIMTKASRFGLPSVFTAKQVTIALFAIWVVALSGVFSDALHTPGILQAMRLRSLLMDKRAQIVRLQDEVRTLKVEIEMMQTSAAVQQREVRRVLGYAAPDELIFDFSAPERLE